MELVQASNLLTIEVAIQIGLIVAATVPAAMFGQTFQDFVRRSLRNRVEITLVNRLVDSGIDTWRAHHSLLDPRNHQYRFG